jgi:hypothetical protein
VNGFINAEKESNLAEKENVPQPAGWEKLPMESEHPKVTQGPHRRRNSLKRGEKAVNLSAKSVGDNPLGDYETEAEDHEH